MVQHQIITTMVTATQFPSRRAVLMGGAAALAVTGCSSNTATPPASSTSTSSSALEKTDLTVAVVPAVTNLGLFLAQLRGFFSAEGLTVNIQPVTSSTSAITSQMHGSVDVTAGAYVAYIKSQAAGDGAIAWRVIAEGSLSRPHSQEILVAAHSPASKLSDLNGQTIGVNIIGNIGSLLIDSALASENLAATAVHQLAVPFPDMASALAEGKIAAGWFDEPFRSGAIKQIGARPLFDTDQGATQNFPLSGYLVTRTWTEKYPNTAAAFARAIAKGQQLASANRNDDNSAMSAYIKGVTPAIASGVVVDSYPLGVNQANVQRVATTMHQFGMLSSPFDVSPMI